METFIFRWVSWIAVSSEEQLTNTSLEHQHATNLKAIEKHNGQFLKELAVNGVSRNVILLEQACRTPGLEAYAELYRMIQHKEFDVLVFRDLSRLGRTAPLILAITELCRNAGIVCYETDTPLTVLDVSAMASYDEMLIRAIRAVGAQQDMIKLKRNLRNGRRESIAKGAFPGQVPFGWEVQYTQDGQRVIAKDEEAAATVRMVLLELFLGKGLGRPGIREEMQKRGRITPRGNKAWGNTVIGSMLRLVWRYAGYTLLDGELRPGNWPPIITEAEAQAVQDEIDFRSKARRSVADNPHILSGVVWCERCNRRMAAIYHKAHGNHAAYISFRCANPHVHRQIPMSKIVAVCKYQFSSVSEFADPVDVLALPDDTPQRLLKLDQEEKRLKRRIEVIDDDYYVHEKIDASRHKQLIESVKKKLGEIDQQRKQIKNATQQARQKARTFEHIREIKEQGFAMLDNPDVRAANAWFRQRIRIYVRDREVSEFAYL